MTRVLAVAGLALVVIAAAAAAPRPGVPPETPWSCPDSHPIKGYVSEEFGRLHYLPGGRFYEEASPERCYASEAEARRDGSHRFDDPAPPSSRPAGATGRPR